MKFEEAVYELRRILHALAPGSDPRCEVLLLALATSVATVTERSDSARQAYLELLVKFNEHFSVFPDAQQGSGLDGKVGEDSMAFTNLREIQATMRTFQKTDHRFALIAATLGVLDTVLQLDRDFQTMWCRLVGSFSVSAIAALEGAYLHEPNMQQSIH